MRIEYQNVDIAQEEHVILKGVNFQAEAGEFVYLIGKVGTGRRRSMANWMCIREVRVCSIAK